MRNLKPSEAAMRRERLDFDLPSKPVPPPCLEARIEEISGFESRRPANSRSGTGGRGSVSGVAMIAAAAMIVAVFVGAAVFLPGALDLL